MAAPPLYLHDIHGVRAANPAPSAVLGDLDLSQGINARGLIAPEILDNARMRTTTLPDMGGSGGDVFAAKAAKSVELRERAIEAAHYSATYAPDLAECLRFLLNSSRRHTEQLDGLTATISNMRICARNQRLCHHKGAQPQPLKKTISGHGWELAQMAAQKLDPAVLQGTLLHGPPAMIGATPQSFNPNVEGYNNRDILRMVIFYNENFEIVPDDELQDRIEYTMRMTMTASLDETTLYYYETRLRLYPRRRVDM
ncbi:hypothetical protein BD779DRAFT_1789312 [Infundibulicybe gibba]|nr:hypothetical protein BD779DRAFT_1789312 [Infundibulicybe gibba]